MLLQFMPIGRFHATATIRHGTQPRLGRVGPLVTCPRVVIYEHASAVSFGRTTIAATDKRRVDRLDHGRVDSGRYSTRLMGIPQLRQLGYHGNQAGLGSLCSL
jgi:hypothetical protein